MKKFNWDEFKNKCNKIVVHCKTEEEAVDFCKQMHEHGMKWCTGKSYMEKTNYEEYKGETCYYGIGEYSSRVYAEKYNYKILEWSDYMQKEFTKADLKSGMVVKYRNGDNRMVINEGLIGEDGYLKQCSFRADLTHRNFSEFDIVGVYGAKNYNDFKGMLLDDNLSPIWERTETKKMTIEEMRKKLEELTGEEIEVTA